MGKKSSKKKAVKPGDLKSDSKQIEPLPEKSAQVDKAAIASADAVEQQKDSRSSTRNRKTKAAAEKVTAPTRKPAKRAPRKKLPAAPQISDDDIRVRAYLIAEDRARHSQHGDESTDWFEAKRQLEEESRLR